MIYVLLPAYNEAENIRNLLQTLEEETQRLGSGQSSLSPNSPIHAVVVNDGSRDDTGAEARRFSGTIPVTILEHETNRGLAAALHTGIAFILNRCGEEDWIVTLDADGTHHPKYIFALAEKLETGYDIVVASRYAAGGKEVGVRTFRKWLSHGARMSYRLCFSRWPIRDFSCGFRGMRASVLRKTVAQWQEKLFEAPGFACTGELMLKMLAHTTLDRVTEIPFELHYEKKGGKSKMPALKTVLGTLRLILRARRWL